MGYARVGFDVVGIDNAHQPRYPFRFVQADAMTFPLDGFDVVHASPPCQHYSDLAHRNGNRDDHPDLIDAVRDRLVEWGGPYVIENVEGAPLRDPMVLCGTMFSELRVIRHRLFESNVPMLAPSHRPHPLCYTRDKRKAHYGRLDERTAFVHVNGGGNCTVAAKRSAMSIGWMIGRELNEAIPPPYTSYVGRWLLHGPGPA